MVQFFSNDNTDWWKPAEKASLRQAVETYVSEYDKKEISQQAVEIYFGDVFNDWWFTKVPVRDSGQPDQWVYFYRRRTWEEAKTASKITSIIQFIDQYYSKRLGEGE